MTYFLVWVLPRKDDFTHLESPLMQINRQKKTAIKLKVKKYFEFFTKGVFHFIFFQFSANR